VVSLKTADTAGKSWLRDLQKHIRDDLDSGIEVGGAPARVILDLRVQPGGLDAAKQLINYGREFNVNVVIREF
jgi:filamentous hemagglutinin